MELLLHTMIQQLRAKIQIENTAAVLFGGKGFFCVVPRVNVLRTRLMCERCRKTWTCFVVLLYLLVFFQAQLVHSVSDLKKKCILNLSGNFGSKQVGRTLKHFSKFSDEKWRKFFFSLFTL